MTKLLEKATEGARALSDEEQDALALAIMSMTEAGFHVPDLDDETRAAIQEGLEQARRICHRRGNARALATFR